jgi:hypothetical protein
MAEAWLHSSMIGTVRPCDFTANPQPEPLALLSARRELPANRVILVAGASGAIERSSMRWSSFCAVYRFLQKIIARDQFCCRSVYLGG